jgi:hypothetical protein
VWIERGPYHWSVRRVNLRRRVLFVALRRMWFTISSTDEFLLINEFSNALAAT